MEDQTLFPLQRSGAVLIFAGLLAAGVLSSPSYAQLPAATYEVISNGGGFQQMPGTVTGGACAIGNPTECGDATATATTAPSLLASGSATSGTGTVAPQASSGGYIYYYYEVLDSASSTPAPVQLTFSGTLAAQGYGSGLGGGTINFGDGVETVCGGYGCSVGVPFVLNFSDFAYSAMSNTANVVSLVGNGYTNGMVAPGVSPTAGGAYSMLLDPTIAISPTQPNYADYSLIFSAGIENTTPVPVPSSLLLMLSALAGFGLIRSRLSWLPKVE